MKHFTWMLEFDGQEVECKITTRPSVNIEEEQLSDGSWKLTNNVKWLPLHVKVNSPLWDGKSQVSLNLYSGDRQLETWTLENAEFDKANSIITYSSVKYTSLSSI